MLCGVSIKTASISSESRISFSVGYLFLILKFFARVSERKPLAEATPNISASFLSSFKTGRIVVDAKFPAPIMPNFTLSLVFEFSSVDKKSIFGSDLMSYLKTTDKGFFSDPNLE